MQKFIIIIVLLVIGIFIGRMSVPKNEAENPAKETVPSESSGWNPISFKPTNEDKDTATYFEKSRMGEKIAIASYPEFPGHANGIVKVGKITKEADGWRAKLHIFVDGEETGEIDVMSNPMIPVRIAQPPWVKTRTPILVELAEVNDDVAEFFVTYHKE